MFLIPYRAEVRAKRFPITTVIVCAMCFAVFFAQKHNDAHVERVATAYCHDQVHDPVLKDVLGRAFGTWHLNRVTGWHLTPLSGDEACGAALGYVQESYDRQDALRDLHWGVLYFAGNDRDKAAVYRLPAVYKRAQIWLPSALTRRMLTETPSWNPWRMITGSLAHAGWEHIIFNLIFFVIFANAVEGMLGPVVFGATILFLMFGVQAIQNLVFMGAVDLPPSLGLSGVIMGVIALFIVLLPRAKIRMGFWYMLIGMGTIAVPAWLVGVWYVAGNIYGNIYEWNSGIGYGAHLSGAVLGLILGMTVFRGLRHWSREADAGDVKLTDPAANQLDDTTGFRYFEAITAAPVWLAILYIGLWLVGFGIAFLLTTYRFFFLWLVPGLLLMWLFRERKRASRTEHERYQEAMAIVGKHDFDKARTLLKELADDGYSRAQLALARLYMDARTGPLLADAAARYLRRAVGQGNREAMYTLAWMIVDRRIIARERDEDVRLFERALALGEPRAAMALAHLYGERGVAGMDSDEVKEKRIALYESAIGLFLDKGKREDAETALRELAALAPGHPTVRARAAEFGIDPGTGEPGHPDKWSGIMRPWEPD